MTEEQIAMNRKWIEALRSGEYRQGRGYLRKITIDGETQFCCLGVLAHLANVKIADLSTSCFEDAFLHTFPSINTTDEFVAMYGGYQAYQMPPGEWFTNLTGIESSEMCEFASLNDQGHTFNKIANTIEGLLPKS